MQKILKTIAKTSIFSLLVVSSIGLTAHSASAQIKGMDGTYVGGGVAVGVTESEGESSSFGGNIQGRFDVPRLPLSLRGSVLFNGDTSAIMPLVSYDIGVAPNTNLYVGGGYSFVEDNEKISPLGSQDSVVLTVGAETAVQRNIVLYGDAKLGVDAYQEAGSAVSLQLGAAYRF